MLTLPRVESEDLPSGNKKSLRNVIESAGIDFYATSPEVVRHIMQVLAMLSLNAKIFTSLSEWESFLNQEDTLGIGNIQRDYTKWILFVSSQVKKLAKAVFARGGGYTRDGFSTELITALMSTLTCEPPLETFVVCIAEDYSAAFPSSEPLSISTVVLLLNANPACFWFSLQLLGLLLLFYCTEPSAAFRLHVPALQFSYKNDKRAYRRTLRVLVAKVLQSKISPSTLSIPEQMECLVECCNRETTGGEEKKKKLLVVVPKKVVDALDSIVGKHARGGGGGGKDVTHHAGDGWKAHPGYPNGAPEGISSSFAPSSRSTTGGEAAPTHILADGEEWQEVSFHWLFRMEEEVLSKEVGKEEEAAGKGYQPSSGLSSSSSSPLLHDTFRIAVVKQDVEGVIWEEEEKAKRAYMSVDDAASAIVAFAENVWRTKGRDVLIIPSKSTKKKMATREEDAATRFAFHRRIGNLLLSILRGQEGRANPDFFASPERLLESDGWVSQQDIDTYIEGKLQLGTTPYSIRDMPLWISQHIAHHDILGRLEWQDKGRRVRATHAHANAAKDLYKRILMTKDALWTFVEKDYFCFSRVQKEKDGKEDKGREEEEDASGTTTTHPPPASSSSSPDLPLSSRPPSRFAWIYCARPLEKEIETIVRNRAYTAVAVPGVKLLLPNTVMTAQRYPKDFPTAEQIDKDFHTSRHSPLPFVSPSTDVSAAPPADATPHVFHYTKKMKHARRATELPVERREATSSKEEHTPLSSSSSSSPDIDTCSSSNIQPIDLDEDEEEEVGCVVQPCAAPKKKGFLEVDLVVLQEWFDIYACPSKKVLYAFRRGKETGEVFTLQQQKIPICCFTGMYQEWVGEERVDIHPCSWYPTSFSSSLCVTSPPLARGVATISIFECGLVRDQYLLKCIPKLEQYNNNNNKEEEEEKKKEEEDGVGSESAELPQDGHDTQSTPLKNDKEEDEGWLFSDRKAQKLEEMLKSSIQLLKIRVEKFLESTSENEMELELPTIIVPFRKRALKEFKLWLVEKKLSYVIKGGEFESRNEMCPTHTAKQTVKLLHNTLLISKDNVFSDDQLRALYREVELPESLPLDFLRRALTHTNDNWSNYEEHEFIGDAVLGCVVAVDTLLRLCREGRRTREGCARRLHDGLRPREEETGRSPEPDALPVGRATVALCCENAVLAYLLPSSLQQLFSKLSFKSHADIVEAFIGVMYDAKCGMDAVRRFIQRRYHFLSALLKAQKESHLVPLSLPAPPSPSSSSKGLNPTKKTPAPSQRMSEYTKLQKALQLCPYRDGEEEEADEASEPLQTSAEIGLQGIGVPPNVASRPFSLFGFAYGDLIHVIPSELCLPSLVGKEDGNDPSGQNGEDDTRTKMSSFADLNPLSCYNSMRGFSRVSFSSHATHFTSGDVFCYRRIYEEELPHVRSRVIAGAETLSSQGQSCMTFINELFTHSMRFVMDYDSSNIFSWNFLRHFLEWAALQEARGGGECWRAKQEKDAAHIDDVEVGMGHQKEEKRPAAGVDRPHPKVLVASSCSGEKDSYHIHVLNWIIPTAAYEHVAQDVEQFIWKKRFRLISCFRAAVASCHKVFPILEGIEEGGAWMQKEGGGNDTEGRQRDEKEDEGPSRTHSGSPPVVTTSHLWLPFLDGPTLLRLRHAMDPPAPLPSEEKGKKTNATEENPPLQPQKKRRGGTPLGRRITAFLNALSPYDAAKLFDVPPSHIFLGEVDKTTQRQWFGVYCFFQSLPSDPTTGAARVVEASRWILGKTILQNWKDFCEAPLPFSSLAERYVPPALPSGGSPSDLTMWQRFWFSYIDKTLHSSRKLRQVYCDKFDMRKGRQYRPFFPFCLATTTPAHAGFAGGGGDCGGRGAVQGVGSGLLGVTPTRRKEEDGDGLGKCERGTTTTPTEERRQREVARQVVFPPHSLYSVTIPSSTPRLSFWSSPAPLFWPQLSLLPQPPRTNPSPREYVMAKRAREHAMAEPNKSETPATQSHSEAESDSVVVPIASLHSLHWSRVLHLTPTTRVTGGTRPSPVSSRLKKKFRTMMAHTRSASLPPEGKGMEEEAKDLSPLGTLSTSSDGLPAASPIALDGTPKEEEEEEKEKEEPCAATPLPTPFQKSEADLLGASTCGERTEVRVEVENRIVVEEEEEEEASHLWPSALHRRAVWSAHNQWRQDGERTTPTIDASAPSPTTTAGGGGGGGVPSPSVTIAAMDVLHCTSLRQPFVRDVHGMLYSSWNAMVRPEGGGGERRRSAYWDSVQADPPQKGGTTPPPPSVIASLATVQEEEWWRRASRSLFSLGGSQRFCMGNKITKEKATSVERHRGGPSGPLSTAMEAEEEEEEEGEVPPCRGFPLAQWRWGESDRMAPPAQWNMAGSADLYAYDWDDRTSGAVEPQRVRATFPSPLSVSTREEDEEKRNMDYHTLRYPTTIPTTTTTTTPLASWTHLSSLSSPPHHFQNWLKNMFVLSRTYQSPRYMTNYTPITDWMDEKMRVLGNATAKPQCLHPVWLEQDEQSLQWRLIVLGEVLLQTSPSLPFSPLAPHPHTSDILSERPGHPPSGKEKKGCGEMGEKKDDDDDEEKVEASAERLAAHKLCLLMQRLMHMCTPQIPLASVADIRSDLTPILEEARKARQQAREERKRWAARATEEEERRNAMERVGGGQEAHSMPVIATTPSSSSSAVDGLAGTTSNSALSGLLPHSSPRRIGKYVHFIALGTSVGRTYFTYPHPSPAFPSPPPHQAEESSCLAFRSLDMSPVGASSPSSVWLAHLLKAIATDRFADADVQSTHTPTVGTCLVVLGRLGEEEEADAKAIAFDDSAPLWRLLISSLSSVTPFVWNEEELESRFQKLIVHEFTAIYYIFEWNPSAEKKSLSSSSRDADSLQTSIAYLTHFVKHTKSENIDKCSIVLCPVVSPKGVKS